MDLVEETKSDFLLSKWYLDCVDIHGNVFIGYSAVLQWKKIILNYSNIFYCDNLCNSKELRTLKKLPSPIFHNDHLNWIPSKFQTHGTWKSIDTPINKTLLNSNSGVINWVCYQPKANGNILIRDKEKITGLGYTEKLEMNIKPWMLPFNTLRWGRFLSEENTVVWINWQGEIKLNLLFYNGQLFKDAFISDDEIIINNGETTITFSDKSVLRKGPIVSTALSKLPGLKSVFPKKILNTIECKWRSTAILKNQNQIANNGWVIHEIVRWE